MPEPNTDHLIATLEATPRILAELVAAGGDAAFDKAWPGEWPPRTVLAHLRDVLRVDASLVRQLHRLQPLLVELCQPHVVTPLDVVKNSEFHRRPLLPSCDPAQPTAFQPTSPVG